MRRRLLFGLGLVLLVCAIAEVGARVYVGALASEKSFLKYASIGQLHERFGEPQFQVHRHLGYCLTPGYARRGNVHNRLGFRGAEITREKPAGTRRVVCIGASTTYGWGSKPAPHLSYPALLEAKLRAAGQDIEVVNAGTPGWTSLEMLINYQSRLIDLAPDVIVFYAGINDVMPRVVWPHERYRGDLSGWLAREEHIRLAAPLEWSALGRILLVEFGGMEPHGGIGRIIGDKPPGCHLFEFIEQRQRGEYPSDVFRDVPIETMLAANSPKYFERNVRTLVALAKRNRTAVVLTTFAFASTFHGRPLSGHPAVRAEIRRTNGILRQVAKETGAELFDLAELMPDDPSLYTDGVHFTEKGNRLRVELLCRHTTITSGSRTAR